MTTLSVLQGMIYLHDSVIKYHGSLSTSNCLVDSRWVVKLADFGLHEFKKDAECDSSDVIKKYHGKKETLIFFTAYSLPSYCTIGFPEQLSIFVKTFTLIFFGFLFLICVNIIKICQDCYTKRLNCCVPDSASRHFATFKKETFTHSL